MAEKYGVNFTKNYINVPAEQAKAGEVGGVKRVLFDQLLSGGIAADTLKIGKLPKGARILEVKSIGAGTGASFNVSPGDLLSSETEAIVTIGTSPAFPLSAWVEYVID